jgi:O-antigen ligase
MGHVNRRFRDITTDTDIMSTVVREGTVQSALVPREPTTAERAALRVLQIGAVAVVLIAVTDRAFELDRFFVPKELTLHLTALVAGILAVGSFRRVPFTPIDLLLLGFLGFSAASTFLAEDRAAAVRALAISVSGVAIFWAARAVGEAGLARPLLRALAVAAVAGAVTALLQAYGVRSDFFSINRAPGGTFGNRNFVAHVAAFSLPLVLLGALRAWRAAGYVFGAVGVTIVVATLILTRSRAGWLAFAAVMVVLIGSMILCRALRRHRQTRLRLAGIAGLVCAGIAAAILVPNSLEWRSENPYLESVTRIADYQEGSGAGRLVQYGRSMRMALDAPLLGVGPGNWSVIYPEYADTRRSIALPQPAGHDGESVAEQRLGGIRRRTGIPGRGPPRSGSPRHRRERTAHARPRPGRGGGPARGRAARDRAGDHRRGDVRCRAPPGSSHPARVGGARRSLDPAATLGRRSMERRTRGSPRPPRPRRPLSARHRVPKAFRG